MEVGCAGAVIMSCTTGMRGVSAFLAVHSQWSLPGLCLVTESSWTESPSTAEACRVSSMVASGLHLLFLWMVLLVLLVAGLRVSTSKSEAMVLCGKTGWL